MRGTAVTLIDRPGRATWLLVAFGIVSLAVAMGIGRFAFTPLLPLMLRDGSLDAVTGAEWAAANYGGYLLGALTASCFAQDPRRGLLLAMAGVALTTLAIAGLGEATMAAGGALLRAASGVFSAWALVCTSSWCLAELARRQSPHLGAWIYSGVGIGITLAGAFAWLGGRQPARWLWLELGMLAIAGAMFVAGGLGGRQGQRRSTVSVAAAVPAAVPAAGVLVPQGRARRHRGLVTCYGILGFGYIVPATFLPAMARGVVADPLVFGLTWPLFGLAAALSVAAAALWLAAWPRRRVWALAHAAMAVGTVLPMATQALWSLAAAAVLVGGTFMVATMAGLQLAREQSAANPTPLLARMTAAFAVGQIAGPVVVRALGTGHWAGMDALELAHAAATVLLCLTTAWLWRGRRSSVHQS